LGGTFTGLIARTAFGEAETLHVEISPFAITARVRRATVWGALRVQKASTDPSGVRAVLFYAFWRAI